MKIKVLKHNTFTRDCTIGEVYEAAHLELGDHDFTGAEVDVEDGYQFTDDVGDMVSVILSSGAIELVEE